MDKYVADMDNNKVKIYKLPVKKIIIQAFIIPWVFKREILSKLFIPIFLLVLLEYVNYGKSEDINDINYLLVLFSILIYVYFAVTCHRIILLGDDFIPQYGFRMWTVRDTKFLIWMTVMILSIWLIMFVLMRASVLFIHISQYNFSLYLIILFYSFVFILAVYVLSRLSLIFPSTAVDEMKNIKWAWNITHGNAWRLALIVVALPMFIGFTVELIESAVGSSAMIDAILYLVTLLVLIIEVSALSLAYKEIRNSNT